MTFSFGICVCRILNNVQNLNYSQGRKSYTIVRQT